MARNQGPIAARLRDRNPPCTTIVTSGGLTHSPRSRMLGWSIRYAEGTDRRSEHRPSHRTGSDSLPRPGHGHTTEPPPRTNPRAGATRAAAHGRTVETTGRRPEGIQPPHALAYPPFVRRRAFRLDSTAAPAQRLVQPPVLRHQRLRQLPDHRSRAQARDLRGLRLHPPPQLTLGRVRSPEPDPSPPVRQAPLSSAVAHAASVRAQATTSSSGTCSSAAWATLIEPGP